MTDVAPKRNLPDAAEAWGRYVDEKLTLVLQALSGANETAGNALRASGGAMNAIVAMTEVSTEHAEQIQKLREVLEPEQIPSPPTEPELSSVLGTVSIRWDGKFVKSGGAGFKEVFAQMSISRPSTRPAGTTEAEWVDPTPWVRVGQGLAEAGAVVIPVETGVNIWVRLVATNYSGGLSTPSPVGNIRSVGLVVGTEIAPNVIVQEHIAAKAVTGEKIAAGALDGMVITGALVQTSAEANRGVKINGRTLKAFDDNGNEVASLGGAAGAVLTGGVSTRTGPYRAEFKDTGTTAGGRLEFIGAEDSAPRGVLEFSHKDAQLNVSVLDANRGIYGSLGIQQNTVHLQRGADRIVTEADGTKVLYEAPQIGVGWLGPYMIREQVTSELQPTGVISMFVSGNIPVGWLECDGRAVSRTTWRELYRMIGTSYGPGDGFTTFNLPNLKGRVPIGYDTSQTEFNTMGKTGGSKSAALTPDQTPFSLAVGSGRLLDASNSSAGTGQVGLTERSAGDAHNNLPPYITLRYIIKA